MSAIIPSVVGVSDALGFLSGLKFPVLDSSGITVPANEASGALDVLGAKQPEPTLATENLLAGLGLAESEIEKFVTAEYPSIALNGSDEELVKAMDAAGIKVGEFATSLTSEFNTQFGEIKRGWSDTLGGMQDMAQKSSSSIGVTYDTAFDDLVENWDSSMVQMRAIAVNEFAQIEYQFKMSVANMTAEWNKAFGSGLTVNVSNGTTETAGTTSTSTAAAERKAALDKTIATEAAGTLFRAEVAENTASPYDKIVSALTGTTVYERTTAFEQQLEDVGGALEQVATGVGNALKDGISLGSSLYPLRSIGLYAGGGLVTSGEFFMARENGMPEFIGQFGNQTGVANNEQIVSGIAGGVESVLAAYIPQIISAIEENAATVNIGDDQIARAASRGAAKYQRVTGRSMF